MKNFFLLVIIGIGIAILYWGYGISKQSREALNWPQAKGQMISSMLTIDHLPKFIDPRADPARWYGTQVHYEYTVDDKLYSSDRLTFQKGDTRDPQRALEVMNKYRRQHEVTVYYDPKDPHQAVLEPGDMGNLFKILIIGGILVLWGIFFLYRQSLEFNYGQSHYILKGDIYQNQGKFEESLLAYNHAINMNPSSAVGYNRRGRLYLQQKSWDKAIADFNQAIVIDPKDALVYFTLAQAYLGKGNYDRALVNMHKAMEKGLNVDPEILDDIKKKMG